MTVGGVHFPCFDCAQRRRNCRLRFEIQKRVFFSIGTDMPRVECEEYAEERYHGIEGVRA